MKKIIPLILILLLSGCNSANLSKLANKSMDCPSVITYAKNPTTKECLAYPTPCAVPTGHLWCNPDETADEEESIGETDDSTYDNTKDTKEDESESELTIIVNQSQTVNTVSCASNCDDGNPCTTDFCNEEGDCEYGEVLGQVTGCTGDTGKCGTYTCKAGDCIVEQKLDCCGNDICEISENYDNCWTDCESCTDYDECTLDYFYHAEDICKHDIIENCCGNGICEIGETYENCELECPDCKDDNDCTTDYYDYELRKCVNDPDILNCCGNEICEEGEQPSETAPLSGYSVCEEDCGVCPYLRCVRETYDSDTGQCKYQCAGCGITADEEYLSTVDVCGGWIVTLVSRDEERQWIELNVKSKLVDDTFILNLEETETFYDNWRTMSFNEISIDYHYYSDYYSVRFNAPGFYYSDPIK